MKWRFSRRSLVLALILLLVVGATVSADTPTGSGVDALLAPDAVNNNPDLAPGCGIDVILVLDASASISGSEITGVRNASNAFLNALVDTGSRVAIVEFATIGDIPIGYTTVTPASVASGGVFANYLSASNLAGPQYKDGRDSVDNGGLAYTNWEYAFYRVNQLAAADLVVFMTDGNPTAYGGPETGTGLVTGTDSGTEATALNRAETAANTTKGNGSHIFSVGVGSDLNVSNLYRVLDDGGAGGNLQYPTESTNFLETDFTTTSDFNALQAALTDIVTQLCKSSLTVIKKVDSDGTGNYVEQAGFEFTGNLTVSAGSYIWISPTTVVGSGRSGVSGTNGQVFFQWETFTAGATASITVAETPQSDFEFVDVSCTGDGTYALVSNNPPTFTVSGLGKLDNATCTVRNKAKPATITVKKIAKNTAGTTYCPGRVFGFSATGQPNFTLTSFSCPAQQTKVLSVTPGTYTVAETDGDINVPPNGWTLESIVCTNVAGTAVDASNWLRVLDAPAGLGPEDRDISGYIGANESIECVFTNKQDSALAVNIASFTAAAAPEGVTLAWETVSETGNAGFNVYRSESDAGPWTQVNAALIPAKAPGSAEGQAYTWTDASAEAGLTYFYQLEDVALSGVTTLHAPVSVALMGPNAVGLAGFGAAATTSAPALAGLAGVALAALAGAGLRRRR